MRSIQALPGAKRRHLTNVVASSALEKHSDKEENSWQQ
jgi:hypothetical protein